MLHLSKSKYCEIWQCPKIVWLKKYKPEASVLDEAALARMKDGNEVGDLAMGLFGDYVEVTAYDGETIDLPKMIEKTGEEMRKGTPVICEASFSYQGLYCAVDILRKENDGWAIYEVKSSSMHEGDKDIKDVYAADMAYQKYVLENCGIHVTGLYLVCLNSDYVFDGTLDLQKLFLITDATDAVREEEVYVEENLTIAESILSSSTEPEIDLSENCSKPYSCSFWNYCSKHLPSPSVFDVARMNFKTKIKHYRSGLTNYEDLLSSAKIKNDKQIRQMEYTLYHKGTYVDVPHIREFMHTLSYPLYFLDFETIQPVIPIFPGSRPYAQVPFQYSLHYLESEGAELQHKEFLAESGTDPRRALAEKLCCDIPMNVCIVAYNMSFESARISELASLFPDLREHLLNMQANLKDLIVPFRSGYYYKREMEGSFSIKSVLPAMFPEDPELDYHSLDGVHNGAEAMTIFPKIQFMAPEEKEVARQNLLKYCKLDTYAMVKIWQALKAISDEA
ncbi:MAG: DUF2779 domain-containing protein [Eubacteriaceae bacterium]|nr:DUF2779 domain-containing protein [Eubacteriaceae bacterium]